MNDVTYLAERVPGAGKYEPKFPNLKKKAPSWTWSKTKKEAKKPEKTKVGPGAYDDCTAYLKTTQSNPRRSVMTKDKGRDIYDLKWAKATPGVGQYSQDIPQKLWRGKTSFRKR